MENTSAYLMIERHQQNDGLRYGGLPGVPLSSNQASSPWNSLQPTTSIPKSAKETAIVTEGPSSTFVSDHQQYRHKPASIMTPSTPISQQHFSYQSPPVSPGINGGVNVHGHVVSPAISIGGGPSMSSTTTPTPSSSSSSSSSYSSSSSGYSPPSSRHWSSPSTPSAYSPYHNNQQQQHFRQTEQHCYDQQTQPMEAGQYHQLASPSPFMQSPIVSTTRSHSVKRNKLRQATYTRWSLEEDERLKQAVALHGPHKWSLIASHVPNRTPMQCSTRWLGALK